MKTDWRKAVYGPLKKKTFKYALANILAKEFGFLGGPKVLNLIVEETGKLCEKYFPPRKNMGFGQIIWPAVHIGEKMSYGKSMEKTKIVPVVLSLTTEDDIQSLIDGVSLEEIREQRVVRLLNEAKEQGGILTEIDVGVILTLGSAAMSNIVTTYQKRTGTVLPYRGTEHDAGRTMSHKRFAIAGDNLECTERYIHQFKQIKFGFEKGMTTEEVAFMTNSSKSLVEEYEGIIDEIKANENKNGDVKDSFT